MPQKIMTDDGKRTAGFYYPDNNTFIKKVKRSRHYLRNPGAWCIDEGVVNGLPDWCLLVIADSESPIDDFEVCLIEDIRQYCFVRNMKSSRQYIITDKFWTKATGWEDAENVRTLRKSTFG